MFVITSISFSIKAITAVVIIPRVAPAIVICLYPLSFPIREQIKNLFGSLEL